jgi:hypothetical protein
VYIDKIREVMKNIKSWQQFYKVNELRTETYSNIARSTGGFPWRLSHKDDGGNYQNNPRAEKEGRVNRLSRDRFRQEFLNQFIGTTINNGGKDYTFVDIKFESNHGNYMLIFESVVDDSVLPKTIYVHHSPRMGYEIENQEDMLDEESKRTLIEMFKYMGA